MTLLLLILIASLGLTSHWLKKYCRGQSDASFSEYMLTYKKQSVASIATVLAAIATLYTSSDMAEGLTGHLASLAFLAGYVGDSAANKGPGE